MYAGRIVEEAPVKALFADPRHPYTRGLMASMPGGAPGTRLRAIQGTVPPLGELPSGCAFAPRCPDRFEPCPEAPPGMTVIKALPPEGGSHGGANPEGGSHGGTNPAGGSHGSMHSHGSTHKNTPVDGTEIGAASHTTKCYLYSPAVEPEVREQERA
jgi:oligopeptide/dipeptide ABC transporter ATP-binding protein